ncbi:hypothetical protein CHS0354_025997 [Potamilus streckersoni]|uniref:Transmembrane protein 26 n=1 Tax=Potamilus streckersoni TaxID=2493646 RepID=A0AAE0RYA8_9BIVA|nr:hypothetical protein CHS0354_025997 [Potamilus streckersoni]
MVTLTWKNGKEWKWFCPSVFFYLASVVPAIWFLELHAMERRIQLRQTLNTTVQLSANHSTVTEDLSVNIEALGLEITIPLSLTSDLWLRVLEQFLLLMLIIGRWLLPKGSISHDELSQLLLVYVGTAADIVEFFEAFNEQEVRYNRLLCYLVLGFWTLSLFQFTLVLTATRARPDHTGIPMFIDTEGKDDCCSPEIYGILASIAMQDLPFLLIRLTLIFKYKIVSYTNMFFTSKNSLVIILLMYRLCVVQSEASKRRKRRLRFSSIMTGCSIQDLNEIGMRSLSNSREKGTNVVPDVRGSIPNMDTLQRLRKSAQLECVGNSIICPHNVPQRKSGGHHNHRSK